MRVYSVPVFTVSFAGVWTRARTASARIYIWPAHMVLASLHFVAWVIHRVVSILACRTTRAQCSPQGCVKSKVVKARVRQCVTSLHDYRARCGSGQRRMHAWGLIRQISQLSALTCRVRAWIADRHHLGDLLVCFHTILRPSATITGIAVQPCFRR